MTTLDFGVPHPSRLWLARGWEQVTDNLAYQVYGCLRATRTLSFPAIASSALSYVQLLSQASALANTTSARLVRASSGASPPQLRLLCARVRCHAGTRSSAGDRTGTCQVEYGHSDAQTDGFAEAASARRERFLAATVLRLQRVEYGKARREIKIYPSQPGETWFGYQARRSGVEQLSALCGAQRRYSGDCFSME